MLRGTNLEFPWPVVSRRCGSYGEEPAARIEFKDGMGEKTRCCRGKSVFKGDEEYEIRVPIPYIMCHD